MPRRFQFVRMRSFGRYPTIFRGKVTELGGVFYVKELRDLQEIKRELERRSEAGASAAVQKANMTTAIKTPETEQIAGGKRRKIAWAAFASLLFILAVSTILAVFVTSRRPSPSSVAF